MSQIMLARDATGRNTWISVTVLAIFLCLSTTTVHAQEPVTGAAGTDVSNQAATIAGNPEVPIPAAPDAQPAGVPAEPVASVSSPVEVELVSDVSRAAQDQVFEVGVRLKVAPGWHIYAPWPGNTGEPTQVRFNADPGTTVLGPSRFQHPFTWDRDNFDLTAFGYAESVLISAEAEVRNPPVDGKVTIGADVSWLACAQRCVGGSAYREITIPVGDTATPGDFAGVFNKAAFPEKLEPVNGWLTSVEYDGAGVWDLKYRVSGFARLYDFVPQWSPDGDCMVDRWSWKDAKKAAGASPDGTWLVSVRMRGSDCLPFAGGFLKAARNTGDGPGFFNVRAFADPDRSPWTRENSAVEEPSSAVEPVEESTVVNTPTAGAEHEPEIGDEPPTTGFSWYFLLLAFAGGLLLNVMPCVIPVIIPKLNHLVKTAVKYEDRRERNRLLLLNGLAYSAGILATMMAFAAVIVALKAVGHEVGWGFQFQNPYFLSIMCAVLMLMSLGMLEVFPLQMVGHTDDLRELRATRKRGVLIESFLTGLLVTFLGTPCTAPLLGPAAGFAFLAGPGQIFIFFAALGVGFALPFLLLAVLPGWSAHLGNFRVSEKGNKLSHGLAFFLLATMVWLIGVMGGTYGLHAVEKILWFLLVLSAAGWMYGLRCGSFESVAVAKLERDEHAVMNDLSLDMPQKLVKKADLRKAFNSAVRRNRFLSGGVLTIIMLLCGTMLLRFDEAVIAGEVDDSGPVKWRKWSQAAVDAARDNGKTVFVDATAKWCMNCRTNEKMVLDRHENADLFRANDVVPFKADFSRRDPEIATLIESHNRVGVPVYLVYPPCNGDPILLPEILTPDIVRNALKAVGPSLPGGCPAH